MRLSYRPRYYVWHPLAFVHEFLDPLVAFFQRGRRGWAERDVWNMDVYLARVIGEMLRELAATDFGYPPNFGDPLSIGCMKNVKGVDLSQDSQWVAYLYELATAFEEYVAASSADERFLLATYAPLCERMRRLFDYYPSLWS